MLMHRVIIEKWPGETFLNNYFKLQRAPFLKFSI